MARPSPGGLYRLVAQQETRRAVDGGRQAAQSVGLDVAATPARRRHRRRRRRRRRRPIDGVDRRHQVAQLQLVQVGLPPVSQSARHRRVPNAKHFSLSTVPKKKKTSQIGPAACGLWKSSSMFRYLRRLLAQDNADSCPESVPKGAENDLETPVLALAALSNCVSHLFYFIASSLVIFFCCYSSLFLCRVFFCRSR